MIATELREITREWLEEHAACEDHVEIFSATFGDRAGLTRANAMRAAKAGLDIDWLAKILLDSRTWWAYMLAIGPTWRAYMRADSRAWRAYQEARAPTWRGRDEAEAEAWRAYKRAIAPTWRAYEEAAAGALCDALNLR